MTQVGANAAIPDNRRMSDESEAAPLTVAMFAAAVGMSHDSVARAIRAGTIRAFRVAERGAWRIHRSELARVMTGGFTMSTGDAPYRGGRGR